MTQASAPQTLRPAAGRKPVIPYGGLFAWNGPAGQTAAIANRLREQGATPLVPVDGVVLGAWTQFAGQGVCSDAGLALACDLDLTNLGELYRLVNIEPAEADSGRLLLTLYRRYGLDLLDRLRGAFALAFWDAQGGCLHVATDFYGIRPVVYRQDSQSFMAASRIRQLHSFCAPGEINPEAVYHYLFFQAVCSPITIYRDVFKLEPGTGLTVTNGKARPFVYYDLSYNTLHEGEDYWLKAIPTAVEQAVARHVDHQEPDRTGCFLSGGTDSSTIAGYYTRLAGHPARTFSIGFDDPHYNELDYARIAASHFGTEQHEYLVTPADVLELLEELPRIYDEPFGNASVVAAYFCARLAREQGIEVMLGGDGGDEIFGGNERYVTNLVFQRYAELPEFFRTGLFEPLLRRLPSAGIFHKAKRYVRRANMPNPRRFYSYNLLAENDNAGIFQPDFLQAIDPDCFFARAQDLYQRAAPAHDTDRLLYLDMKNTITDNDLRKVTQMVEAAGIQVQYPLLDRDLVDFCGRIPANLKVKPGKNRYIFKQAMRGILPDETIRKSKHGMGLPIAKWFKEDPHLSQYLGDVLFTGQPEIMTFIRADYLQKLQKSFFAEDSPYYGDNLWVFMLLEIWLQSEKN